MLQWMTILLGGCEAVRRALHFARMLEVRGGWRGLWGEGCTSLYCLLQSHRCQCHGRAGKGHD